MVVLGYSRLDPQNMVVLGDVTRIWSFLVKVEWSSLVTRWKEHLYFLPMEVVEGVYRIGLEEVV